MPFSFRLYNVGEVVIREGKKSRVNRTFLASVSASISEVAGQRSGGCVWLGHAVPARYSVYVCMARGGRVVSCSSERMLVNPSSLDAVFIDLTAVDS